NRSLAVASVRKLTSDSASMRMAAHQNIGPRVIKLDRLLRTVRDIVLRRAAELVTQPHLDRHVAYIDSQAHIIRVIQHLAVLDKVTVQVTTHQRAAPHITVNADEPKQLAVIESVYVVLNKVPLFGDSYVVV